MNATEKSFCFVVMPFMPELNFFYLRKHLEENHQLRVERGDHRILTIPLLEKIRIQIREADVIIADITGRNPNVFYELGLAHAQDKPVILITQDSIQEIPSDIRHFEFIKYDLEKEREIIINIDNAINNLFVKRYQQLYEKACELLRRYNHETGSSLDAATIGEFTARIKQVESTQEIPDRENTFIFADFILPKILRQPWNVARKISDWILTEFPA